MNYGRSPGVGRQGSAARGELAAGDGVLVARLAAREQAALREVIGLYAKALQRIAYRMIGDAHEAEDIAQEAMLRLWDHAPQLHAKAAQGASAAPRLGAWLRRVSVNLALDRLRAAKRLSGEEVPERADEAPLADAALAEAEQAAAARALIAELPDRQRAAIVLTYYEELPNTDAAAALDMNIKAFESLLHRARTALRKAFEAQAAGEAAR